MLQKLKNQIKKLVKEKNASRLDELLKGKEANISKQDLLNLANELVEEDDSLMPIHSWRFKLADHVNDVAVKNYYLKNYKKYPTVGLLSALLSFAENVDLDEAVTIANALLRNTQKPNHLIQIAMVFRRVGEHSKAEELIRLILSNRKTTEPEKIGAFALLDMMCAEGIDDRLKLKEKHLNTFKLNKESKLDSLDLKKGITFYGADFYSHVTVNFLLPLIRNLVKQGQKCYIISSAKRPPDQVTEIYQQLCNFDLVENANDLAKFKDRTDLLIDCSGFTSSKVLLLNERISKVQLSYLGYGDISPIAGLDGQIADEHSGSKYGDKIWVHKIPNLYSYWPVRRPPTGLEQIEIETAFGVYADPGKLDSRFFNVIAKLINDTGERISFFYKNLSNPNYADLILDKLWSYGIDEKSISLTGALSASQRLEAYRKTLVFLDSFPFSSGTVASEALFVGSKLVTLTGESLFERQCGSIMLSAGQGKFIARNVDEYINIAKARLKEPQFEVEAFRDQPLFQPIEFAKQFLESFHNQS